MYLFSWCVAEVRKHVRFSTSSSANLENQRRMHFGTQEQCAHRQVVLCTEVSCNGQQFHDMLKELFNRD